MTVLALVLAPVVVHLTHGPAAAMAAEKTVWYGHSHLDAADGANAGHEADHEHHVTGLVDQSGGFATTGGVTRRLIGAEAFSGVIRDGPRRPPRLV